MKSLPRALLSGTIVLAIGAAGCASATKRFEQGQELEQEGKSAEAAQRYVQALKKDGSLADARTRLVEVGARAVAGAVTEADQLASVGRQTDAADRILESDALIHDAMDVGVNLQLPAGYADKRTAMLSSAVDQSLALAARMMAQGDYNAAVQQVARAQQRWQTRPEQQVGLNGALHDAQLAWAASEMNASRFKSAYEHGDAAAAVPGFDRSAVDMLQADAVRRGTMLVAVLPAVTRGGVDARVIPELNDLLALEHWQNPPRWIAIVNPIEAQRAVRLRGLSNRVLDPADAAMLARGLDARHAVALTVDSVRSTESRVTRQRHAAKTRTGADTAYVVEEGQLDLWMRVSWRTIDASSRSVTDRGDASDESSAHFRRTVYSGNPRELNLAPAELAAFDQRDRRELQDAVRHIARGLSDRIARDVFASLTRRVE